MKMSRESYSILLAAGGTGGHVFPAISIADAFKEIVPKAVISFVGTREKMEWLSVPKAGYRINSIWISGFHRQLTLRNLLFPIKLIVSLWQSRAILKKEKPDIVVSCGGFASGPIGYVAAKMGIPLVLQEQNSFPGVTTRILAKHAHTIFIAFEQANKWLPDNKTKNVGNPTRKNLAHYPKDDALTQFGLKSEKPVLLILGGSGGARSINLALLKHLDYLHNTLGIQIIWQCGSRYYSDLKKLIDLKNYAHLRLYDFIDKMPQAFAAANLVLSRAGASSCAELLITGKPSILVPSPNVAGDHQTQNAKAMVENGAANWIKDQHLEDELPEVVATLITDDEKLQQMAQKANALAKPNAAHDIASNIKTLIDQLN